MVLGNFGETSANDTHAGISSRSQDPLLFSHRIPFPKPTHKCEASSDFSGKCLFHSQKTLTL